MRLRPLLPLALLAAACTGTDPLAVGGGAPQPVEVVFDTATTVTPEVPAGPPVRTLVMLNDGPEAPIEVARALLAEHAPDAGARLDSIRPLQASRGFTVPLTPVEASAIAGDDRVAYSEP